jgi:hypothetical protein
MAGAYPPAMPTALVVCAAETLHRHIETDQAVDCVTVNPVDFTVALRTTLDRKSRIMDQPPAHAQRNRHQRTQNQGKTDGIGQGDSCQKSAELIVKTANTALGRGRYPPEPCEQRAANIQPLEDQEDTQGDDHQPDDLELVGSQNLAQPALTMAAIRLRRAPRFVPMQLYSPFVPIHRKANNSALVDSDAQAYNGPGITPSSSVRRAVTPSTTCSGAPTLTRAPSSSAGTKYI